jgi:HD-GYP domain-containing protein (c-di-GMP phosphodiesterase class II)
MVMPAVSRGNVLLQFAALSLIIVAALGAALGFLGQRIIGERIRQSAANTAVDTVRPPVEASLAGADVRTPLSEAYYDDVHEAAAPLISNQTILIRLWNQEGRTVFSTVDGDAGNGFLGHDELQQAFAGETVHLVTPGAGTAGEAIAPERVLRVFSPVGVSGSAPVAVLEVVQDYEPTAALIQKARAAFYSMLGGGLALTWLVLQGATWWSTRRATRHYARLAYLFQIGQRFRSSLDLSEVMAQAARDAAILGHGQYGFVCLMETNGRELVLKATYDHEKSSTGHHNRTVDEGYLLRAVATGEAVSARLPERPLRAVFGIRRNEGPAVLACLPMRLRDRVVGVTATVRHPSVSSFSASEIAALQELADQAAMAIEQASLFEKVRSYASDLEMSYDTTLRALMAALDTKDAATEGHSERVARLTVAVAREMHLPEERLLDIERGALLHDLGKIGVPDSVLQKPESLDKEEWESMQKHPLLAALVVSKVGFLEGATPILLYHHERYDGSGYPFGLAGDRIPLEARIFAVVDAYDALTSDRPYRKATSPQEALKEIRANAGIQFDPQVVESFAAVVNRLLLVEEDAQAA